jgi:endonuclease/exonuclease/phosphatase (EEP) superfamily protein YafD
MIHCRKHFAPLMLTLLLAACVSIPTQNIVTSGNGVQSLEDQSYCLLYSPKLDVSDEVVSGSLDPTRIDLLVWNIYKGQIEGWLQDLSALSHDKDLLFLQEVKLDTEMRSMLEKTGFFWQHATAFRYLQTKIGILTASVTAPVFHCMFLRNEPLIRIPKAVLVTRYTLANKQQELLAVNVHGINFELNDKGLQTQLDSLHRMVAEHDGPVIVAGDFNTWSKSRMDYLLKLAKDSGLKSLPIAGGNRSRMFGHDLDLIFYRGLKPLRASSIPIATSDHNPLTASFSLDDRKKPYP